MDENKYWLWHKVGALGVLLISTLTYLLTIEPSASFWDCGEFIASSYKLEVGHPPGNPVYQLSARFFSMFGGNMEAAVLVNSMSAVCSGLTIFFLYLTIAWFLRRIIKPEEGGSYSKTSAALICGSSAVGALVYTFSDTFWFSAVEGEVYAMSSLITAMVFWAMTMWYDRADRPHANKWIVLIAFLMGLSIGVHLLNLLMIPAIVFMYYFRLREDSPYKFSELVKITLIGVVILAIILYLIIPYLPKLAGYSDLLFVNVFGLPYNSGAIFFVLALLALCFWGIFYSMKKGKVFINTALLCFTTIVIGFSVFSIIVIRSSAKTPTNEYQPDNPFTLVRYLSREQYGSNPLIYGQYYGAPYDLKTTKYWAPLDGKYKKVSGPVDAKYVSEGKMLFPRMWSSSSSGQYEEFYMKYTRGKGKPVPGTNSLKPTSWANFKYFWDYQLNWMYWRYFMWNFAGRQNQIHAPYDNKFHGNWESGIKCIDNFRLGNQSNTPEILAEDKGKNHYYFLPLLLGLLGLFFQFDRDKRGCWLNFLMFFMTGIAIVLYLNQPPYQVRERDYAYAGSFYFFSVWAGMAVAGAYYILKYIFFEKKESLNLAAGITLVCLFVPFLMAAENWDDHDRSNRRTAVEMARNYLESVGSNGILITHGDNDTFPLWYAQEVEDVRTDVRICNTSLLGTDWHIDQMKWAVNESAPLPLSVGYKQYLYGTNEYIPIVDFREEVMSISDVMTLFKHPEVKVQMSSGNRVDYIASRKISVPVNKENVLKYGIVDEKFADMIPDSIVLNISKDKDYITKPELFMLDLLSGYQWDRPINVLSMGGDLNMGIKEYLEYQGYSFKLVPIKSKTTTSQAGFVDTDELYRKMTQVYTWDDLSKDDYFIDYQNQYTFIGVMSIRNLFVTCAKAFIAEGNNERAIEMLDRCSEIMKHYPLETIPIGFTGNDYMVVEMVHYYYALGLPEKALDLATRLGEELLNNLSFYFYYSLSPRFYNIGSDEYNTIGSYIYLLADELERGGHKESAESLLAAMEEIIEP